MPTTRMKEQLTDYGRAVVAAKLSAIAYKNEKPAITAAKKLGFKWVKLISRDGAEVLVAKDRNDIWFAFRGTEPSKLNDVMADLNVIKNAAKAGGRVHSGFQQEVNDLWMDILKELEHNDQLKVRKDVYMTGHSLGAAMELGFKWVKLISRDGAEVLVAKDRNDIWFAFRGTEPSKLNDVMADLNVIKNAAKAGGRVHSGFQQEVNDLWMDILKELEHNDQLKVRKDVYMTGHSLGAAMATIAATRYQPHELFTFGSPRVGGPRFIKNIKCPHYRFMNNNDIVCRIPPAWLGFRHHGEMIYFNCNGERQAKPSWKDLFLGIWNSWKRFKFFDGIVDHGMPNYVQAIEKLSKSK